jgi:glutathione synthase/RimK-type ligase-like ATP-grasp enzyme
MLLILAQRAEDETVVRLAHILDKQGADVIIVAPDTLERPSALAIDASGRAVLHLEHRAVDLRDVQAAWLWRSWRPQRLLPHFRSLYEQRHAWSFFENEWLAFYKGFSLLLAQHGIFCVNPPPFNSAYEEKIGQLFAAAQVGLTIPDSLYTARLQPARTFSAQHADDIVYKPFRAYLQVIEPRGDEPARAVRLLTNRVQPRDLEEPAGFVPTPGIFQPYIPKTLELRIVVVGNALFACAIHSQQSDLSRDDWRRYDFVNTPYEPFELPGEIADRIRALMDRLGLVFGSVDMVLTPDGEYVFLEVNPNGQFDFVANLTGMPIYEHLAAMLLAGSKHCASPRTEPAHAH